jgi:hypothetical protein
MFFLELQPPNPAAFIVIPDSCANYTQISQHALGLEREFASSGNVGTIRTIKTHPTARITADARL